MSYNYDWRADIFDVLADPYRSATRQTRYWTMEEQDDLLRLAAERIVEENGEDYYNNPEWAVDEEASDIIGLYAISQNSLLYRLLLEWYGNDEDNMMEQVRDSFVYDGWLFFVTGAGYSLWSADQLGGSSDGIASRQFDDFIADHGY